MVGCSPVTDDVPSVGEVTLRANHQRWKRRATTLGP
jgi:hypothetical protein